MVWELVLHGSPSGGVTLPSSADGRGPPRESRMQIERDWGVHTQYCSPFVRSPPYVGKGQKIPAEVVNPSRMYIWGSRQDTHARG